MIEDFICVYPTSDEQIEKEHLWSKLHVGDEFKFSPRIQDGWLIDRRLLNKPGVRSLKILAITPLTNSVCLTLLVDNNRQLVLNFDEWPETTVLLKKLGKGWTKCQR